MKKVCHDASHLIICNEQAARERHPVTYLAVAKSEKDSGIFSMKEAVNNIT